MQDASLRPGLGLAGRASMRDTMTTMEILIVDDEKNIRSSLSRFFELHGNEVMTAENGREAVESIRKRSFDCVLLDLKLPDMEGIQVLERIREIDLLIPVILLTAHGTTGRRLRRSRRARSIFS